MTDDVKTNDGVEERRAEEPEKPLSKKEAAELLGISTDTLDIWTRNLGLRHIKYEMPGNVGGKGRVAYLPSDILAFREQFMVGGESGADGAIVGSDLKV
jgi:hypothetical protein